MCCVLSVNVAAFTYRGKNCCHRASFALLGRLFLDRLTLFFKISTTSSTYCSLTKKCFTLLTVFGTFIAMLGRAVHSSSFPRQPSYQADGCLLTNPLTLQQFLRVLHVQGVSFPFKTQCQYGMICMRLAFCYRISKI